MKGSPSSRPSSSVITKRPLRAGFRNIKEEARAKARALHEAANPSSRSMCHKVFAPNREKTASMTELQERFDINMHHPSPPPTATHLPSTANFRPGFPIHQPTPHCPLNNPLERDSWSPDAVRSEAAHVEDGQSNGGNKVIVPMEAKLNFSERASVECKGVSSRVQDNHIELDLNLALAECKGETGVEDNNVELDLDLHL